MKKILMVIVAAITAVTLAGCVNLDKYAVVLKIPLTNTYVVSGVIDDDEFKVVGIQKYVDEALESLKEEGYEPKAKVKVEKTDAKGIVYSYKAPLSGDKLNDKEIPIYKLIITYEDKDGTELNLDLGIEYFAGLIKLSDVKNYKTKVVYSEN